MRRVIASRVAFVARAGLLAGPLPWFLIWLLPWLLITPVLGCAGRLPETHYYTLLPPQNFQATTGAEEIGGFAIGVESFTVDPPYDQDRLVYRPVEASAEVGFYAYHRWASPLGRLVAVALADGLRGTAGVAAIEPAVSTGSYSARLRGRVIRFEEVELASTREARMTVEVELVDRDGERLWKETITSSGRSGVGSDPIAHFNSAFQDLLDQARASLAVALQ